MKKLIHWTDLFKRGNLPSDDRKVPLWLQLKNGQYDKKYLKLDVLDDILALNLAEFDTFLKIITKFGIYSASYYFASLSKSDITKLYAYLDTHNLTENKEKMAHNIAIFQEQGLEEDKIIHAIVETKLMLDHARHIHPKMSELEHFIQRNYCDYSNTPELEEIEEGFSYAIWIKSLTEIPMVFEKICQKFFESYDDTSAAHQQVFTHLCHRFGLLIGTCHRIMSLSEQDASYLEKFSLLMMEQNLVPEAEIIISESNKLSADTKLIHCLTSALASMCEADYDNYALSMLCVIDAMREFYPLNTESFNDNIIELIKGFEKDKKEISKDTLDKFIMLLGELPQYYKVMTFTQILDLKEAINQTVAQYQVIDTFEKCGNNTLILHNYRIDMEDLYSESIAQS